VEHQSLISLSVAWPPFEQKLAAVLEKLEEDQFLVVSAKRSNLYVQFAAQGAHGMRVETASNSYLEKSEQLNEQQSSALIEAGWHAPTGSPTDYDPDGSPNFFVDFSAPVPFEAVANLTILISAYFTQELTLQFLYQHFELGELPASMSHE